MQFIDIDLARRVEMAEANAGRECAEAFHRLHPEFPVAVQEIAGGIGRFCRHRFTGHPSNRRRAQRARDR